MSLLYFARTWRLHYTFTNFDNVQLKFIGTIKTFHICDKEEDIPNTIEGVFSGVLTKEGFTGKFKLNNCNSNCIYSENIAKDNNNDIYNVNCLAIFALNTNNDIKNNNNYYSDNYNDVYYPKVILRFEAPIETNIISYTTEKIAKVCP